MFTLGYKHSSEARKKISLAKMGKNNPMFGGNFTEEHRRKMSESKKGKCSGENNGFFGKKHKVPTKGFLGRKHTEETKGKIALSRIGDKNPAKRLEVRMKISNTLKGHKLSEESLRKWFKSNNIKPNKKELQLQNILDEIQPDEWIFVGDGKVIIEGFCPDFINNNGKKLIIELFGNYWHTLSGSEETDKRRLVAYTKMGYKTLIIWEKELKEPNKVKTKIETFGLEGGKNEEISIN